MIMNRRGDTNALLLVAIGLVLVALILVVTYALGNNMISWLVENVKNFISQTFEKEVKPTSIYASASRESFARLNGELTLLLKSKDGNAGTIVPYTLGGDQKENFRLVGFNRNKELNERCLSEDVRKASINGDCKGYSCMCLCNMIDRSCNCDVYKDIEYIYTTEGQYKNDGGRMEGVIDPKTGEDAYCIELRGYKLSILDTNSPPAMKIVEFYNSHYHSANMYLEKSEKDGKNYLLIGRADGFEERLKKKCPLPDCTNIKTCFDYYRADCKFQDNCNNEECKPLNGLSCEARTNPAMGGSLEDGKDFICAPKNVDFKDICIPSEGLGFPVGALGDFTNNLRDGKCMECRGIGGFQASVWGWVYYVSPEECS
jgi:hypothetical protein